MKAVSTVVIAVGIIVIIAVAGIGFYALSQSGGRQSTTSASTTSTSSTNTQTGAPSGARQAFEQHLSNVDTRNVELALNDYTDNTVVIWTGHTAGLGGTYSGKGNLRLLFSSALSTANQIMLSPADYLVKNNSASQVTVNATLSMSGTSQILGAFNGTIEAQAVFTFSNGAWKITNEAWYYKTFNVSSSAGATTFPEWQRVGEPVTSRRSPDWLHNFAWDFGGPGAAILIYFSVGVLLAVLVMKRAWKRSA